jgi:hypothetical protein
MNRARLLLHACALIAPFVAALTGSAILMRNDIALGLEQTLMIGAAGAFAAEIAALIGWRAIERRAAVSRNGWPVGLGMAATTHLLFGVMCDALLVAAAGWRESMSTGRASDLVLPAFFFALISAMALGAATFPLTALLAQWITAVRQGELVHADR